MEQEHLEPWAVSELMVIGAEPATHLIDVGGAPLEQGIASLEAHEEYLAELGGAGDVRGMLESWTAEAAAASDVADLTHALGATVHRMA